MAATPVAFFTPTSPFGAIAGWEVQTGGNPTVTEQRASEIGSDGDEIASEGYDKRSTVSATYKPTTWTGGGSMSLPVVGSVLTLYHVDSISVAFTQTDFPTLTVNGHLHNGGNGHTDGTMNEYTPKADLIVQGIGVPTTVSDTTSVAMYALVESATVGLRSMTYSLAVTHEDELNSAGNHLAGENRDGIETYELEFTGLAAVTDDYTISAGLFVETDTPSQGNTAVSTESLTLTQHIEMDA
jgi:hypothetical protein